MASCSLAVISGSPKFIILCSAPPNPHAIATSPRARAAAPSGGFICKRLILPASTPRCCNVRNIL